MQSFIHFVLRLNLDISSVLIIRNEYWGIPDECAIDRAADLLPRLLFVVELESYLKHDHFVNVYTNVPLLLWSLQIILAAWCINFQCHFPYAYPEFIFARNLYIVGSGDDQR